MSFELFPCSRRLNSLVRLLTLTATLFTTSLALAQSTQPAVFVAHNIATNLQFDNYAAVSSFTVNNDGTVNYVGNYFTNDNPQAIALSPNGRYLAVTHGTSNGVTEDMIVFRVEPNASLTMLAVTLTPDSPLDVEWLSDEYVACTETRTAGNNKVHTYRLTESNPIYTRLQLVDSEPAGVFTAYLQRHPSGQFLFSSDSDLGGANIKIRTYAANANGTLDFVADVNNSSYLLDMAITHDGTKLYSAGGIGLLSGGSAHLVHGFLIDPNNGIPSPIPGTPFFSGSDSPAHVAVTGDDQFLLVGHGGDGSIRSFTISPEDGFLTDTGFMFDVGGQGDIGAMTTLGNLLVVTKRYSGTNSPSGLRMVRVLPDGSFVQIGGNIDTHGTASDAVAAWIPAPNSRGDVNNDGNVDELDIAAFVAVLLGQPLDPSHVERSDFTSDGAADGRDLPLFVQYYLNPIVTGACCRFDGTCDITLEFDCVFQGAAQWVAGAACVDCPAPPPVITGAFPDVNMYCNYSGSTVFFSIVGSNFAPGATARLVRPGQPDRNPLFISVDSSDFIIVQFNIGGAEPGLWNLEVVNPDNQVGVAPDPILIEVCP